ncbi:MAG: TlpA family protein disulfide reductase [Deltaproteobacteria bacterium]|nr:TlpA family protein disulfide reductase [Deltaproteobacteria bacterium]
MRPRPAFLIALAAVFAVAFSTVSGASAEPEASNIEQAKGAYITPDGYVHPLAEHKGETLLLVYWAKWCGPCLNEIPTLNAMHDKYAKRGLKILALNIDESTPRAVRSEAYRHRMKYPVGLAGQALLAEMAIHSIPRTFLFAKDGTLLHDYTGAPREDMLAEDVENALKGRP